MDCTKLVSGVSKGFYVKHAYLWLGWRGNFYIGEDAVDKLDISSVVCHEETPVWVAACNHRLGG